ncbi:ATP-dependent helicase HrpB [Paenibacillus tarimensis]
MFKLPIDSVIPELKAQLSRRLSAVLIADPGAGKTTRVPLTLMHEAWLSGQKILMLEPRRLAARSAAKYMAASIGEQTGDTVGYRVRMDSRTGPRTRIEVVTEGILTRMLQSDPALEGVGLVIFDEFHERSVHTDLGLALCLQTQQILRDDLRILVMSATMDGGPVAALLGGAPIIRSEGRAYPVRTVYARSRAGERFETAAAATAAQAYAEVPEGDVLVFLPGAGEINKVTRELSRLQLQGAPVIVPLYGSMPLEAQDAAIMPSKEGKRKIVLATSIAETSLTVEGVRIVVDGGKMRVPRFSARTGMTRLETVTVSRASADQRRGRAGRTAPGVCYRLWTEEEDRMLPPAGIPEIMDTDLAPLALELCAWGVADPSELKWLNPPPAAAYRQAIQLLSQLNAVDSNGRLTEHGKQMASIGGHPRLIHMLLRSASSGNTATACRLAALLSERDMLRKEQGRAEADLRLRLEALEGAVIPGYSVDPALRGRILAEADRLQQSVRRGKLPVSPDCAGLLLAYAYPDRIAKRRSDGRFLLQNGRGAYLREMQPLSKADYIVAAELDDEGTESRILLAAPIERDQLEEAFAGKIEIVQSVVWDREQQVVKAREKTVLGALVLSERPLAAPDPQAVVYALADGIRQHGLHMLPWTKPVRQLQQRMIFMNRTDPSWPAADEQSLLQSIGEWLSPHLYGMKKSTDLQRLNLKEALESMLTWEQKAQLDRLAPTHITVPSGSRIAVDYSDSESPVLAVKLQELFGLQDTPRIGNGKIPLTLHLLSPAQRPVQVTRDLRSFWSSAYFEVKKDLKGRYPKHYWPDDPSAAVPTHRVRPKT